MPRPFALSRRTLLSAALAASLPGPSWGAETAGHALWIWGTPRRDWPQVAAVMAAEGFSTAYLSIPPAERGAPDGAFAPFVERGIAVWLVGGDPAWADGRPLPAPLADLLRMARGSGSVAGVQLDIEPYTLPLWKSGEDGRRRIATALLARLAEARTALAGTGKRLGMVLHPSFANAPSPSGGSLADGIIAEIDEAVVMAYRNRPEATERFAQKLLTTLDRSPKPWRFGITVQGGPDQALISYADAPLARVRADMATLDGLGRGRASGGLYQGVAVHAYASLLPKLGR